MAGVDAKHVLELAAAEDEQPVEALATDGADPALGVGVRIRCLDGRADHGDSFALQDVIAAARELGVAIVDQEAARLLAIIKSHQQVARLLGNPGARWVRRAGDELDPAALQRDEEEHVDPFQPGGLDAWGAQTRSSCRGFVFVEEAAEEVAQSDMRRVKGRCGRRIGSAAAVRWSQVERSVWSLLVEVADVDARTCSSWRRRKIRSRSGHSLRTLPTQRSA
jgi:hypothetical protein